MLRNWTTEQKAGAAVIAGVGLYGLINAEKIKEQRREAQRLDRETTLKEAPSGKVPRFVQKVPTATDSIVDHPVFQWALENSFPWIAASMTTFVKQDLFGPGHDFLSRYWRQVLGFFVAEESLIAVYWFLSNKMYQHIPFFAKKVKEQTCAEVCLDYMTCNLPVFLVFAALQAGPGFQAKELDKAQGLISDRFRPLRFLLTLGLARWITDFFFWLGHYLIHMRSLYFIHKRHHEHNDVKIFTNYHFSPPDLAIEALLPLLFTTLILKKVNPKLFTLSEWEVGVLSGYVLQLEVASHAGKALPYMSTLPPIGLLMKDIDDWNPWFHTMHHRLLRCNYSITPFWDMLFGTARYK